MSLLARRFAGLVCVLLGTGAVGSIGALVLAPAASATYPGRNGKLAYEMFGGDDANGNTAFSGISSIPLGSRSNCVSPDGGVTIDAPCTISRIGYSPDGRHIVAQVDAAHDRLEVLDAHGRNVRRLRLLTSADDEPAYLPNGRTLVFTGTKHNQRNLYEVGIDGTRLTQLTRSGGSWPAPCGNGSIAYLHGSALYLRQPNGRSRLLVASGAQTPDCAPNSGSVTYQTTKDQCRIVSTAGGTSRAVRGHCYEWPTFSPDGTRIGSISQENSVTVITLSGRTISSRDPGYTAAFPAWQPLPR